jgi:hypothetical protein
VGRLEEIVERNRNPRAAIRKSGGRRGVGITGVVLFVVLILLCFTDLAHPPQDPPPPPADRVHDIKLGAPIKRTGSGSAVPVGSARP